MSIFFIGGASGSGKSTAANEFSASSGIQCIELDYLFNNAKKITEDEDMAKAIAKEFSRKIIEDLLKIDAKAIIEGGWVNADVAKEILNANSDKFLAAFCGYPNATDTDRLKELKKKNKHYIARKDEKKALRILNKQIESSGWYKEECKKYDITFIDFTDFDDGSEKLKSELSVFFGRTAQ